MQKKYEITIHVYRAVIPAKAVSIRKELSGDVSKNCILASRALLCGPKIFIQSSPLKQSIKMLGKSIMLCLTVALPCALVPAAQPHRNLVSRQLLGSSFGVPGNATYDYVVVGGGTAGLAMAARLAEKNTVAVVEAGSFYEISNGNYSEIPAYDAEFTSKDRSDVNPLVDWGFVTTPQAVSFRRCDCKLQTLCIILIFPPRAS